MSALPRVDLIALGGTIASIPNEGGNTVPSLTAAALVAGIPGLDDLADLRCHSFRQLPGAHLTTADLIALADFVRELASEGTHGVVVTQGTDTIEETAFALDMLVGDVLPVVVTGAMRGPSKISSDGPANLIAAIRIAACGATSSLGTVVVMDDTIHGARWVRKLHSSRPSAFSSPTTGPLGWMSEDRVSIAWYPSSQQRIGHFTLNDKQDVALLTTWLGDDGRLVDAAVDAQYAGIVVQATGGGHVSEGAAEAIGRAAARLPVVIASRTGSGELLRSTYGFIGSETDLARRGAIFAGQLDAPKARLLLELLLSRCGKSPQDTVLDFARVALGSG